MTEQAEEPMGGYWHAGMFYPYATTPTNIPITEEAKMNDLEDANMIRELVAKIGNYLVERTELAKRVGEQEAAIETLRNEVAALRNDLTKEQREHDDTKSRLGYIREALEHEQSTVGQLVSERDSVRDQLTEALKTIDILRRDVDFWTQETGQYEKQRNDALHASHVCQEQREQMAGQVSALKAAFKALQVLE